ncbi:MAG: choice-of-anchor I family protein [Pseudomonadota bacterium]
MLSTKNKLTLAIACAFTLGLSGCFLDGDDGDIGPTGPTGPVGADGEAGANAPTTLNATIVGRSVLNDTDPSGAAEIVAFQASKGWVYAVNSSSDPVVVEIMDINSLDAAALAPDAEGVIDNTNLDSTITLDVNGTSGLTGDANSIAVDNNNEVLAVAVAAETGVRGSIAFYDVSGAAPVFLSNVEVGFLPDNVVFTHDGSKAIVANEGEPAGDYSVDPEGSISIIELTDGVPATTHIELTFGGLDQATLEAQGAVFANPDGRTINGNLYTASVAQDLEPEYVAIAEDDSLAFVAVQENNALAIVDLATNSLSGVIGLGFKDWGNLLLDASDRDGGVNLTEYPGLFGMYQPDTIDSYTWNGANFIVTANEGDGREYFFDAPDEATCLTTLGGVDFDEDDGCLAFIDEIRAEDLTLAANFDYVNNDDNDIGRLLVTTFLGATDGSTDGSGTYDELYTYGARSFTIWDTNGLVVYDSGDDFERITASIFGPLFNNNNDENEGDTRSDAKGPEPEALALGMIEGRQYAFVGLERMGGVMAYDITNPYNVQFVSYFVNRGVAEGADITGDLAPEGMAFISATDSPTGEALLVIGNEESGSVVIYEIVPE